MSSSVTVRDGPNLTLEGKFSLTRVGLVVIGPGRPTLEQYEVCFQMLYQMTDTVQMWLGDLYNSLQHDYGDDGYQVFDGLHYERRSITNFARVSRLVPIERRRAELAYGHHDVVAPMSPYDQTRLLDQAVREHLTVQQLRRLVREHRGETVLPPLGQALVHLIEIWREDVNKAAADCATELEDVVHRYGLDKNR